MRGLLAGLSVGISVLSLAAIVLLRWAGRGFGPGDFVGSLVVVGLVGVGALVLVRRPGNPLGPLFALGGVLWAVTEAAMSYARLALGGGDLPGGVWTAAFGSWASDLAWGVIVTFGFLLFPNGRLPSRRWRPVAWAATAVLTVFAVYSPFVPGTLSQMSSVDNPLGIGALGPILWIDGLVEGLFLMCVVVSFLSVFVRYWGAPPDERQRIKWVAYVAVLLAADFVAAETVRALMGESPSVDAIRLAGQVLFAAFPLSIGVAILMHRLYDIDRIINKTLVYATLTASLAAIYLTGVASMQYLFRTLAGQEQQPQLTIVVSTLAIAALFSPLRRGIQGFIDRRFYRRRYDAARTLESFSATLRDETDLESLGEDLVAIARETVQPAHARLWLRERS